MTTPASAPTPTPSSPSSPPSSPSSPVEPAPAAATGSPGTAPGRQLLSRADRQAQLLRAAATAFARAGFAATSMDDVAAEAGVTKLIVYRNFDSKLR